MSTYLLLQYITILCGKIIALCRPNKWTLAIFSCEQSIRRDSFQEFKEEGTLADDMGAARQNCRGKHQEVSNKLHQDDVTVDWKI